VVVIRDKLKQKLEFYGPLDRFYLAVSQIADMLKEEFPSSYQIDLTPFQFLQTIHGGFKNIEQALGRHIAVFNVVSRTIIINGTQQQYKTALNIVERKSAVNTNASSDGPPSQESNCPICFCEAENQIQISRNHSY
jgi:hypothetical protein